MSRAFVNACKCRPCDSGTQRARENARVNCVQPRRVPIRTFGLNIADRRRKRLAFNSIKGETFGPSYTGSCVEISSRDFCRFVWNPIVNKKHRRYAQRLFASNRLSYFQVES